MSNKALVVRKFLNLNGNHSELVLMLLMQFNILFKGQESNASSRSSNLESIPGDINTTGPNSVKDKKEGRSTEKTKKKSSWYNALYPTYKSKSEDFKRIFKDVPDDERLVVGKFNTPFYFKYKA